MSELPGKLTSAALKSTVLSKLGKSRSEVKINAAFGTDTSVISTGNGQALAVSSDPLSLIPGLGFKESALLSVHLTANDMATTGFAPQYAQFVLNLPVHLTAGDFEAYWHHIHQYCRDAGIAITGGHTGRIPGQESTVPGGTTMFLIAPESEILTSQGAQPGDALIMTKEAAISSTSILAKSFPQTLEKELGSELYQQAVNNFYRIPAQKEALIAAQTLTNNDELTAMHDVTEGGILGAVLEMARASNCGVHINSESILAGDAQRKIAAFFNLDYRKIIGAGSMLMAVKPQVVPKLQAALKKSGIESVQIGKFTDAAAGYTLVENGKAESLQIEEQDPYWSAFFEAVQKGMK